MEIKPLSNTLLINYSRVTGKRGDGQRGKEGNRLRLTYFLGKKSLSSKQVHTAGVKRQECLSTADVFFKNGIGLIFFGINVFQDPVHHAVIFQYPGEFGTAVLVPE